MFVKVTYAQTIELDEVFITNDPEEEEEYLDDCDPDSNNYVECYCYPENCEDSQTQENCNKTCPDSQTLNTVSCTCVNKPNKNWYQDLDNDGYHSATKSYYKSPGTKWKTTTLGPDCDDTKKCVTTDCTKVEWYLDNDGDGWYGQKKNDYAFCKPEGSWNITSNKGFDCNDYEFNFANLFCFEYSNPCANTEPAGAGATISSDYGVDRTVGTSPHRGIDYGIPTGTPVSAMGEGNVVRSGWSSSYGWTVIIDHGQGVDTTDHIYTLYGHLQTSTLNYSVGKHVDVNNIIANSNNSGSASHGAHLHVSAFQCPTSVALTGPFYSDIQYVRNPHDIGDLINNDCN